METIYSLTGPNQLLPGIMAQTVAAGAWIPIVVLIILLLIIVGFAYRGVLKNVNRPKANSQTQSLSERNEQLKKNLAEIEARNRAELEQTRAILEQARNTGDQVVNETREGVVQATREETERARADIIRAREQHLNELRLESTKMGQDEPPQEKPGNSRAS